MDRSVIYTAEQGRSVDFLFAQRAIMIAIGKLAQAALGSNTVVRGLAVTPNSPAALNVLVGIGEIYTLAAVDATTYGSLAADSDQIVQQGLNMAAQTISTPAPSTSGYSIAYLIEAQFQSQDTTTAVLPFYNSANPSIPLNGQGGSGATLPTERQGVCVIQAKAGVAATTGTQVTPTVDAGWTALAVVTVANGQTTVTSGNITIPAGVPQISSLVQMMQTGSSVYAVDTSASANTITLSLTPAITTYVDGEPIRFKAANSNTGPCTINWGGGSIALNGASGAFQGGEIIAGGQYEAQYNSTTGTALLLGQTAGAIQVSPAIASNHAPETSQIQRSAFNYAGLAGGTANALTATLAIAPGSYTDYLLVTVRVAANNTTSVSLNVNGLGVVPVIGLGHQPLQGGELLAGGFATFAYSTNYSEAILLDCTGGAQQIAPATQSQHASQFAQLLAVSGPQAVLSYTNTTTITLSRYRTGYVYSPGYGIVQIPIGGLTATASGLTPGTLYYIYLNPNAGSPTLVASMTTHQTDSSGVEVMSGDSTKVLVGMAYAITATSWLSVVRSWVHDRGISLTAVLNTSSSTNSTTPVNVNTGLQISFLAWTNELAQFSVNASCSINTTNTNIETYISLNNSAISGAVASATPSTTNVISETVTINSQSLIEGLNTINMFGQVGSSSATGTWYANQTSTNVTIAPRA